MLLQKTQIHKYTNTKIHIGKQTMRLQVQTAGVVLAGIRQQRTVEWPPPELCRQVAPNVPTVPKRNLPKVPHVPKKFATKSPTRAKKVFF